MVSPIAPRPLKIVVIANYENNFVGWAVTLLVVLLCSPSWGESRKAICGISVLPNGESVKNCLGATFPAPTPHLIVSSAAVVSGSTINVLWSCDSAYQSQLTYGAVTRNETSTPSANLPVGVPVTINAPTTFTLQCTGPGGTASVTRTVAVTSSFTANLLIDGVAGDQTIEYCYKDLDIFWNTMNGVGAVSCNLTPSPLLSPMPFPTPVPSNPPWTGATGHITDYSLQLDHATTTTTTFTLVCSDSAGHSDTQTARITLNRKWPTDGHISFVTRGAFTGNLGGLVGANSICQSEGDASQVRPGATWKAVISTLAKKARSSLSVSGPVYTPILKQREAQAGRCVAPYRQYFVENGCGLKLADGMGFWRNSSNVRADWKFPGQGEATGTLCSRATATTNNFGNPSGPGELYGSNVDTTPSHGIHMWMGMTKDNSNCVTTGGAASGTCREWTSSAAADNGNTGGRFANQGPWNDGVSASTTCGPSLAGDAYHPCNARLNLLCISQ